MGYFKSWRRKIGVLMLVLAFVFVGGWVRSLSRVDTFDSSLFPNEGVRSHRGEIYFISKSDSSYPGAPMIGWWSDSARSAGMREFEGPLGALGFGFVRDQQSLLVGMPYWSIVIPLTLLAALDLLKKQTFA